MANALVEIDYAGSAVFQIVFVRLPNIFSKLAAYGLKALFLGL
jgi:hypothetical protein